MILVIRPTLEAHKNKVHLNIRPYKCDKCDKSFTGKPFLDKHRRFHNESDSSYHYCDWTDCKFRTKYMNNLKEHRLRHERDRQFRCAWPGCGQSFYNNRDMTQHMKSHEDQRTYRCDWPGCESTFKRHTYLSRHKRLHMNSDDAFPCVWPGCGKAFNTKKKLANHSTLHKKQLEDNVHQMVRQSALTAANNQQSAMSPTSVSSVSPMQLMSPLIDPKQLSMQAMGHHSMQALPGLHSASKHRSVIHQNQNQMATNQNSQHKQSQQQSQHQQQQQQMQHQFQSANSRMPAQMGMASPESVAKSIVGRLPAAHTHQQQFGRTVHSNQGGDPSQPTPTDLSQHRPTAGQVYNAWSLNNFYH